MRPPSTLCSALNATCSRRIAAWRTSGYGLKRERFVRNPLQQYFPTIAKWVSSGMPGRLSIAKAPDSDPRASPQMLRVRHSTFPRDHPILNPRANPKPSSHHRSRQVERAQEPLRILRVHNQGWVYQALHLLSRWQVEVAIMPSHWHSQHPQSQKIERTLVKNLLKRSSEFLVK